MLIKVVGENAATEKTAASVQVMVSCPSLQQCAPPVQKCNHIFRKGGSRAREERVYRIQTHCHYPAQVL